MTIKIFLRGGSISPMGQKSESPDVALGYFAERNVGKTLFAECRITLR